MYARVFEIGYECSLPGDSLLTVISQKVPKATPEQIGKVLELWPADPKLGSPYGTGDDHALTPVYKQLSAILGDFGFQVNKTDSLTSIFNAVHHILSLNILCISDCDRV